MATNVKYIVYGSADPVIDAEDISIVDTANYFTTTNVESVLQEIGFGLPCKITNVVDTYNVLTTDKNIICNKLTDFTITLPISTLGMKFIIKNIGVGNVTVDGNGTETIDGETTQKLYNNDCINIVCYQVGKWVIE